VRAKIDCRCAGLRSGCSPIRKSACLLRGPLFVGETYTTEREVVALSGSRRTESMWVRTTVFGGDGAAVATMLLNGASIKQSYARYEEEYSGLYRK